MTKGNGEIWVWENTKQGGRGPKTEGRPDEREGEESGSEDEDSGENNLAISTPNGEVYIDYSDDFYSGSMDMPGKRDDYEWNYRRSSASALVASAVATVNTALFLF